MPQVTNGLTLGVPGAAGSSPIFLLYGAGSPANSSDPNVTLAQLGSLFVDYTTPGLWFKTSANAWTQISVP